MQKNFRVKYVFLAININILSFSHHKVLIRDKYLLLYYFHYYYLSRPLLEIRNQ